ncbi:MAG: hypothetical protein JKY52_00190 [Flavobacteriales bacterium]|nr:hypothetical protein [Flavobacteriales bacterium]
MGETVISDGKTFHCLCMSGAGTSECTEITALGVIGGGVIIRTKTTTAKTVAEALTHLPGAHLTEDNGIIAISGEA